MGVLHYRFIDREDYNTLEFGGPSISIRDFKMHVLKHHYKIAHDDCYTKLDSLVVKRSDWKNSLWNLPNAHHVTNHTALVIECSLKETQTNL